MSKEFVGALSQKVFYMQAIRNAFEGDSFNVCCFHRTPKYLDSTFAGWVSALHCKKNIDPNTLNLAKTYCVNYFLCPEVTDEFELEAYVREVFPEAAVKEKVILKVGNYELRRLK